VAVVVDNAIADFPVLCDIFEALLFLCSKFFCWESEVSCGVLGGCPPPAVEVLAIEKRGGSFGRSGEERSDQKGESKQECFHREKIHIFEKSFITKMEKVGQARFWGNFSIVSVQFEKCSQMG